MKKLKNKGFTLIELLVVVAIIGILAAVGVVAYSGYTSGAKKQAASSNHKAIVKYIISETMKCSMGNERAMGDELDCSKQNLNTWKDVVAKAAERALADFKNPYSTGNSAVRDSDTAHAAKADMGYVNLDISGDTITVTTCFQNDCAASTDDVVNKIDVAE